MYADVAAWGCAERVVVFNTNYRMLRGVAGASEKLAAYGGCRGNLDLEAGLFLTACSAVALLQMGSFGEE